MSNLTGKTTFVFKFVHHVDGTLKTEVEEKDCWNWTEASGYFHQRLYALGITGSRVSSCSFQEKGTNRASTFGGANIEI